jgi:fatty acid desaturase
MLNQNYHLVHHLWPRIPWFRYGQAAAAAEQALQAHRDRCRDDVQPAIHGSASATTPRTSITP